MKMLLLYEFVSENFVNYYTFSQPHLCKNNNLKHNDKKGEKEKDNDLSSQNNISEGILTNEI